MAKAKTSSGTDGAYVRLSVNLSQEAAEAFRKFSRKRSIGATEAVRRMIALAHYIDEVDEQGKEVLIRNPRSGRVVELKLL